MPLAAPSAALFVSSDRCAEASYPVIVLLREDHGERKDIEQKPAH